MSSQHQKLNTELVKKPKSCSIRNFDKIFDKIIRRSALDNVIECQIFLIRDFEGFHHALCTFVRVYRGYAVRHPFNNARNNVNSIKLEYYLYKTGTKPVLLRPNASLESSLTSFVANGNAAARRGAPCVWRVAICKCAMWQRL